MDFSHNTCGLHCRVWVVDWQSRQGYNVFVMAPCERREWHGAKLLENLANLALSGRNGMRINGEAPWAMFIQTIRVNLGLTYQRNT